MCDEFGHQLTYTELGFVADVMQPQMPRRNRMMRRCAAEVSVAPIPGFNLHGDDRAHYELVSTGVDITDPDELALHDKAFGALRNAASYGDAAKELIRKASAFWSGR